MSPLALVFLFPVAVVLLMIAIPVLVVVPLVYVLVKVARYDPRPLIAKTYLLALHLIDVYVGVRIDVITALQVVRARIRYAARVLGGVEDILAVRANLQEIREVVHRVDRGDWPAELGDPFETIMYETKQGIVRTGSLIYGDVKHAAT